MTNYINQIKNKTISKNDLENMFKSMLNNHLCDDEIVEILDAFQINNITEDALFIGSSILKDNCNKIVSPLNAVDIVGTGGDNFNTFNISTTAFFVVAACGIPVCKHGGKSVSSSSGATDIISELGIDINKSAQEIENSIKKLGYGFMPAPIFHPIMKNVASARAKYGKKSIFNYLGPLSNPAGVKNYMLGVSNIEMLDTVANTLIMHNVNNAWVFCGENGLDEISTICDTNVISIKNNVKNNFTINPNECGFNYCDINEIQGKDPKYNAQKLIELLNGKKSQYRNNVVLNACCTLIMLGKFTNFEEAKKFVENVIDNKNALEKLNKLVAE